MATTNIPDTDEIDVDAGLAPSVEAKNARVIASAVGIVHAQENVTLEKSASLALITKADINMSKSGSYWTIARSVEAENTGSLGIVAGNVKINRGWVGIVAAPRAEISEDSRVFMGPAAAAIIGLALLGVFGIVSAMVPRLLRQVGEQWPDLDRQAIEWMKEHG